MLVSLTPKSAPILSISLDKTTSMAHKDSQDTVHRIGILDRGSRL